MIRHAIAYALLLWGRQPIRFLIVGGFVTAFSYVAFIGFDVVLSWSPRVSLYASFVVSMLVSFVCHKYLTFVHQTPGRWRRQLVFFTVKNVTLLLINDVLLSYLIVTAVWAPWLAQGVLTIALAGVSYVLMKIIFAR